MSWDVLATGCDEVGRIFSACICDNFFGLNTTVARITATTTTTNIPP